MTYSVQILRQAQKELGRLPAEILDEISEAIAALGRKPRPSGCLKLTGRDGWRIRVGNYRVVYEIDEQRHTVTVLHVGHRRDVYR